MNEFHKLHKLLTSRSRKLTFWWAHYVSNDRKKPGCEAEYGAIARRIKLYDHAENRLILLIVLFQRQKADESR